MSIRRTLPLVGVLTAAFVALPRTGEVVFATENSAFTDSDGDFLPDGVEWVALTNANQANTDGDAVGDFIEFVQAGRPRQANPALPIDHELRVAVVGPRTGAVDQMTWLHIFLLKAEANAAVVSAGGTITHHHAVGRDHRSGYQAESPPLFADALRATKRVLDPAGILNPGVLIDPEGRSVGVRGAMAHA